MISAGVYAQCSEPLRAHAVSSDHLLKLGRQKSFLGSIAVHFRIYLLFVDKYTASTGGSYLPKSCRNTFAFVNVSMSLEEKPRFFCSNLITYWKYFGAYVRATVGVCELKNK